MDTPKQPSLAVKAAECSARNARQEAVRHIAPPVEDDGEQVRQKEYEQDER